jgi:hypothetical protein
VVTTDSWESIPPEKRLAFAVVREPLEALSAATIANIERRLPPSITNVLGAPPLLLLLTKVAETTFSTIRYFCAETPEDPARRLSFASSAPPLVRSLLDEIYTVIFVGEDVAGRVLWYNRAGWREMREEHGRHLQRYKGKSPEWDAWLAEYGEKLDKNQTHFGITAQEAAQPKAIQRWPTPAQMLGLKVLGPENQKFLEYMQDWFYREFSQADHLSLPGLIRRGAPFLLPPDEKRTENTKKKLRSDWVGHALLLYLAFLTEVILLCGFDFKDRSAYIWGILKEYSPIAAEVWQERYNGRL